MVRSLANLHVEGCLTNAMCLQTIGITINRDVLTGNGYYNMSVADPTFSVS